MRIGFVSMPLSGHLNPMTALARRLKLRGNDVAFFGVSDVEPFARAAGLDFVPYGETEYPAGSMDKVFSSVAKLHCLRWCVIPGIIVSGAIIPRTGVMSAQIAQIPGSM
jgi:UDP:flavonoid glycosyltransferase YjiC (YdhE family)